ncbi:MAG: hypothetical protein ACFNM6_05120 [Prevotella sp.]
MKTLYISPITEITPIAMEKSLMLRFSQVDNDGDGVTDQQPIIEGDPDEIGAKQGWFSANPDDGIPHYNSWED